MSAQGETVLHLACRAFFHSRNEIFLFPHPHCVLPPASFRLIVPRPGGKGKGLRPLSGAAAFLCRLLPEDAV
jgi:hypothetical protein